jgi:hypothetical protein
VKDEKLFPGESELPNRACPTTGSDRGSLCDHDLTLIVRPPHGSAEEFATSEDPHCKDGGKACIDCLLRGACLMAADDTRCDDDASWNASDENRA